MSSEDWHRFLGFGSASKDYIKDGVREEGEAIRKRKRCPFKDETDEERFKRRGRLRQMDAEEQRISVPSKYAGPAMASTLPLSSQERIG